MIKTKYRFKVTEKTKIIIVEKFTTILTFNVFVSRGRHRLFLTNMIFIMVGPLSNFVFVRFLFAPLQKDCFLCRRILQGGKCSFNGSRYSFTSV